jgi:hypothetical protein
MTSVVDDAEIARRFRGLADLLRPPRVPAWTPGTLVLSQELRQRAFQQRYKLDVSLLIARDGRPEVQLRLEPLPRISGREVPPSLPRLAEALDRLGYVGRWDPEPGHAATNGSWRRPVPDLAAANDEVAFVQRLAEAMQASESRAAKATAGETTSRRLSGWPLVEALRSRPVGDLTLFRTEFERAARVVVDGRSVETSIQITFLAGSMLKAATSRPGRAADDAGRLAAEASVRAIMGRTAGQWLTGADPAYMAFAPLKSLEAASRFVDATDSRCPEVDWLSASRAWPL